MFQIEVVEKIKIHILCTVAFSENRAIYAIMSKTWWGQTGRKWQYGGALHAGLVRLHAHMHTPTYPHTNLRVRARTHTHPLHTEISNNYCCSTATVVSGTRLKKST